MGFLQVGYPGISKLPTSSPVLCSVPSYVSLLHDLIESLRAAHIGSGDQSATASEHSVELVRGSTPTTVTRFLGACTDDHIPVQSQIDASFTEPLDSSVKDDSQRPRSASPAPNRSRRGIHGVRRAQIDLNRGDTAAALKDKPQQTDSLKGILKERLDLLALASAGGGAASYGLSTTVNNPVIRAKCEAAFRSGRLLITLAELVDAVLGEGSVNLPDAVAIVREEWWRGGLRLYDGAERLLQPHLISRASSQAELAEVVKALHTAQASPTCAHLTWPLLHTILECFQRERLRSTLDLILETCSSAFGVKCCVWDIIVAAGISPPEACVLEVAPWPVPYFDNIELEQNLLAWGVLTLNNKEALSQGDLPLPGKVFPQYSKCLEKVVENEFDFTALHSTIQSCLQQAHAHEEPFTLPVILARVTSRAPRFDGLVAAGASFSCGALLWIVEKSVRAQGEWQDSRRPSFGYGAALEENAECNRAASMQHASGSSTDVFSSMTDIAAASGSLDSLGCGTVAETVSQTGDDTDNDYEEDCDTDDEDDEEENSDLVMSPLEAFVSCFYKDLLQHHPLYLTSVNNLFRMRSGGRRINYQKHGYSRMAEFLAEVPGVELSGMGNQMEVKVRNASELTACAQRVMKGLNARVVKAQQDGLDASQLSLNFAQPKAVPHRILEKVWRFFQQVKDHEVHVNSFLAVFKQMYPNDKLHFRALGYPDVRGLMAQVRFVEKVGGRRHARYRLKEGALPPKRANLRSTRNEGHANWLHRSQTGPSPYIPAGQAESNYSLQQCSLQSTLPSVSQPPGERQKPRRISNKPVARA